MKFAKTQAQKIVAAFAPGLSPAAAPALIREIERALAQARATSEARGYKKGDRDAWLGALALVEVAERDLEHKAMDRCEVTQVVTRLRESLDYQAHKHEKKGA